MGANTKIFAGLLAVILLAGSIRIVIADDLPPVQADYVPYSMDDLQQMVAPIALYPDALLAQVLAACTYPNDVIAAAQWEDAGNDPQNAGSQPWDSSVQGVARYPSVLHYLAGNTDLMNDLGDAFLNQQSDVMTAVQTLRAEALAAGTLVSTPQQTVINEDGYIQIIPTNPGILYVPIYDPAVCYAPPPYDIGQPFLPYITFGIGCQVGDWLDFDCDWHDCAIYTGHWGSDRPWWHDHDGGRDPRDVHRYIDDRPGVYQPGRFVGAGGRAVNVPAGRWTRDDKRPAPRPVNRPAEARVIARPERGYPAAAPVRGLPARNPSGAEVARQSQRGQASRQRAAPAPAPREAPVPRPPPRAASPPPEARPSAPVRGGAMGGYESHASAAASSARGSSSRGGGGGGHAGGGKR